MSQYQLTEKGIKEARKKRTTLKGVGEAVTFGGAWKGEEYANVLLISLLEHDLAAQSRKPRDAQEITVDSFSRPRPKVETVSRTLGHLVGKGYVRVVEPSRWGRSGFSDQGGQRLSRIPRRGFKKVK